MTANAWSGDARERPCARACTRSRAQALARARAHPHTHTHTRANWVVSALAE